MENKPLLSICIPTYNRANFLKECLDSILNQKGFNEKEIEIIISDNASEDNTTNIVESYQKKIKNIKYYRNKSNLGMVKNCTMIVDYATGKYTWIISDDDTLYKDTITEILYNLKKSLNNIFILNYSLFDKKLQNPIKENIMKLNKDINILNPKKLINNIIKNWDNIDGGIFLFISSKIFITNIFKSSKVKIEILNSNIKNEKKYAFPFTMILFNELFENGCYFIANTIIKSRIDNCSWDQNKSMYFKYYLYKYIFLNTKSIKFKLFIFKINLKNILINYILISTKKIGIYFILSKIYRRLF